MFSYASAKAIATKKGYVFKCSRRFLAAKYINDSDKTHGSDLPKIFNIPQEEILKEDEFELVKKFPCIAEKPLAERTTTFEQALADCPDNVRLGGHLISTKYFDDILPTVRTWFQFPQDTRSSAQNEIARIKNEHPGKTLCAVHFRVGRDYTRLGYKIDGDYQQKAATRAQCERQNIVFVVFYDRMTKEVTRFLKQFPCVLSHNSMIVDMCAISLCDCAIIANSSFSIWSALLSAKEDFKVWRPSCYPVSFNYAPTDCFLEKWEIVPAKRSLDSTIWMLFRVGLARLKNLLLKR